MNDFIEDIIQLIPKLTEKKVYKILCSIKARNKKYGTFGLGKRDGCRFGISTRQMTYFIDTMINYGFLEVNGESRTKTGHKCRIFKLSQVLTGIIGEIKDYVFTKLEYINPLEYVKARFVLVKKGSRLFFKVAGIKYQIATRGRFRGVIYDIQNDCIINPLTLGN